MIYGILTCKHIISLWDDIEPSIWNSQNLMPKTSTLYNSILRIAMNLLETRENIKIESHSFYYIIYDRFSWGSIKKKKNFFLKKKVQNGRLKKRSFFNSVNSWYFFLKISWIRPWVSRIDWFEGHWFSSTYMVVRLSDISSKTGKKCFFGVFGPF